MNSILLVGIAGGSGSGKTTLANLIKSKEKKESIEIINLDNYQKFNQPVPITAGMKNWDSPDSINWEVLKRDLKKLKSGKEVALKNRNQKKLDTETIKIIKPEKIILVEGYLLFHSQSIRNLLDYMIYLDTPENIRIQRRTKKKGPEYVSKILLPMHNKFIEPTKKHADLIINTEIINWEDTSTALMATIYSML